jgi:hypothetical protein
VTHLPEGGLSPPQAHKATHEDGGSDEISVAGLSGVLADPQPPIIGAGAAQAVAGNDARLTNARTPTAHATSHQSGGSDAIKLDDLAAPDDNTDLNASAAKHGLMQKYPGGATNFLREDGSWQPAGGGGPHAASHQDGGGDEINVAGLSGLLADPQTAAAHAASHKHGGSDEIATAVPAASSIPKSRTPPGASTLDVGWLPLGNTAATVCVGNDTRLSDARTPLTHDILTKHNGFPGGTANFLREDGTFAAPTASLALTTVELNLGAAPNARRGGHVQITGLAGLTAGKPVLIQQAAGPYTGKGTRADEAEVDMLTLAAKVLNATTIDVYWQSKNRVRGNFKFNYLVSA